MSNHRAVVQSFLKSQPDRGCNLVSDGKAVRSYGHLVIAEWKGKGLVVYNYTSKNGGTSRSTSTTRHVNMVMEGAIVSGREFTLVNP
ncbi:MAG TPA: hypothetical protein EYN67_00820 [Flavobacteriales bacterium]|nr:hypothetical protein [Flavobacteriales bacterium]